LGGLGILDYGTEQSITHLVTILGHSRAQTVVTNNILQLLESYQICAGITTSPLQETQRISYVSAPWLDVAREFLQLTNATIHIPHLKTLNTIRIHDKSIMSHAMQFTDSPSKLRHINQCRLYLRVTTIAEISNGQGSEIMVGAIYGTSNPEGHPILHSIHSESTLNWPAQPKPPPQSWGIWKRFLTSIVTPQSRTTLKQPLGEWLQNYNHQRNWHYIAINPTTIIHHATETRAYKRISVKRYHELYEYMPTYIN
jgi:hypothetical protein